MTSWSPRSSAASASVSRTTSWSPPTAAGTSPARSPAPRRTSRRGWASTSDVPELILWAGFLGAWLLVAGPVWQAVVELGNEEFERARFTSAVDSVPPPERVSSWWWLLPPLGLYLSSRSHTRFQHQVLLALPDEEYDAFSSFMAKARGWMLVGLGGLLILSKETW